MSSEVRIAVSGKSGCGNTTVSRLLAERLGIRLINYTFHDMAVERGIPFEQLCLLAENDDRYDRHLDRRQVELALEGSCVLASRLAIWLLEEADLSVYLYASAEVRARRIAQREGIPWQQSLRDIQARDERDRNRYLRLYGIDIDRYEFADLIVDTEKGDQFYVVDRIMEAFEKKSGIGGKSDPA
jgi:cytidylate kinase